MARYCGLLILFVTLVIPLKNASSSTFAIKNQTIDNLEPINYVYWLDDQGDKLNINDVLTDEYQKGFRKNESEKLNFGFSNSGIWLKINIKNESDYSDFIFEINNSDLNFINCYKLSGNQIIDSINTGELRKFKNREIKNRNFLFDIKLNKNESLTCYFYVYNSNDAINIPFSFYSLENFYHKENIRILMLGLFFGFGMFIILFNFYLFFSLRDRIHLFYALYIFFTFLFTFNMDGLSPQFFWPNSPKWSNSSTFLFALFGVIFLINFVQEFLDHSKQKKIFSILKVTAVVLFICTFFDVLLPFSILGLLLVFSVNLCMIVFLSYSSLNKEFIPNHYFLGAFLFMIVGAITYAFRELGILPYNVLTKNAFRIAITFETIILTIAIIERFRVNQQNAKKTIERSHNRIEIQNKELEIINTELEKLSIVASETDNSVAIYDQNGRIEWCNEGFERFYETNISKLIEQKKDIVEDIIPYSEIKDLFKKCISNKVVVIFEAQLKFSDKNDKWMRTTLSPYTKGNKVIAVDTDITSLKEYETELKLAKDKAEESDRIKTIFLSNMSHEVRTPLNGILGFSELLNNEGLSMEERGKFVEIIKSNGEQLIRIIDDILDMSLIETNQLKIWNSDFSLTQLCEELVEFFQFYKSSIEKSDIKLIKELNIDTELDLIHSDNSRLKQVLMNVIKNGFKFTDEGYVKLGCSTNDNNILFFVEDTGIGIEQSKIDHVFERFRQADEKSTRKYGGNGLGLSISKGIIEKMGGNIWIDPEYTIGFRICFVIPLEQSEKVSGSNEINRNENKQRFKSKDKSILIVEDHDTSYQYLESLLQPFTSSLLRAKDGNEAVQKIKENHFDLVLMDINLPELDGIAATKEVRKFNKDIPIIAQTAYVMTTEESSILESGCNDVISKPINSKKLFEKIEANL